MTALPTPRDEMLCRLVHERQWFSDRQIVAALDDWLAQPGRPLVDVLACQTHLTAQQRRELLAAAAADAGAPAPHPPPGPSQPLPPAIQRYFTRQPSDVVLASEVAPGRPTANRAAAAGLSWPQAASAERFQIQHVHAQGGLGVVYIARDEEIDRSVALKQIKQQHAGDEAAQARFLLEARITGRLEHPGIVPVYALGVDASGRPFYAMRLIRGDSLHDVIERFHGRIPGDRRPGQRLAELRRLLRRFTDVCNAVDYAHSKGVIHRDLKPSNIMIGKYGETLVVDWGLAKVIGAEEDVALTTRMVRPNEPDGGATATRAGAIIGTPAFMSPEQAAGRNDELGPATDVFSLGATLYQLLTGKLPRRGDTDLGVAMAQVAYPAVPPPRRLAPWLPRPLDSICMQALAPSPAERYPSARALADDVDRWLGDEPVAAHAERWYERLGRRIRGQRSLAVALAAVYILATTAALAAILVAAARR